MEAEVDPGGRIEILLENLEKRVEKVEIEEGRLKVEAEDVSVLERTPGVESFTVEEEKRSGIGGKPVEEMAFTRIESREDAVRAFLATVEGYNLVVLETERIWDLRQLRRYNPDIKHLKSSDPVEELGIERCVGEVEGKKKIGIEMPDKSKVEKIYREKLT
ncbi:MAG: hypothetical protein ABEJ56_02995 [Candidatus Nanohaloarchaea archaeon]